VFLDRDGTMIHDPGYLARLEGLQWYPWTIDAIRLLNRAGFLVFVTTNQGGVALGLYEEAFVHTVHGIMTERITAGGGRVDGWFYCLHHPRGLTDALRVDCDCRKPRPGMIRQAQERFSIDLAKSFVVGDKLSDVGLAAAVGARAVLVRTGHGAETEALFERASGSERVARTERGAGAAEPPALIADNLMEACAWILRLSGHPREAA
jgi:D-glycero-D-manno-heptose 1,7-bisphosphate phosphatase